MVSCTSLDTIRIEVLGEARAVTAPAAVWIDWMDKARGINGRLEETAKRWELLGTEHGANQMKQVVAEYLRGVGMHVLAEEVKENCHWPKERK